MCFACIQRVLLASESTTALRWHMQPQWLLHDSSHTQERKGHVRCDAFRDSQLWSCRLPAGNSLLRPLRFQNLLQKCLDGFKANSKTAANCSKQPAYDSTAANLYICHMRGAHGGRGKPTCPIQKLAQYAEGWLLWQVHQNNPSHKRHSLPHAVQHLLRMLQTADHKE